MERNICSACWFFGCAEQLKCMTLHGSLRDVIDDRLPFDRRAFNDPIVHWYHLPFHHNHQHLHKTIRSNIHES